MKRKKHGSSDDEAAIDMTPMLDIVFIMLIFFIVTTSFVKEKGLDVLRPKDSNSPPPKTNVKSLAIRVNQDGTIMMNSREVDIRRIVANIQSFLAENNTDSAAVQAHPKAKHGVVTEVINQAKEAGITNVSVLVGK
ncbi:ExbD/TolR family protein [Paraglaciecola chathamensis]|jgi:biopolymer transport protein ExbD|uniref:Biopolymer transporter ExbD n=3 Tax=Paraglaciecola chathamensis TaxID=368405 RepID=A0A8H9LY04_9ALTE|nr:MULTISPECIES: biopolymer transporter ExbD [Paraglaciecola]AEE21186.1 Biopolymer transport protein ExbD/TolR [Glaciecola sp. 4H-3-7+YE-5]MBN27217.1 biopolymer transporter ExbD [Alteromonadaceae bacterium]MBJ2138070.1 biopolymer transporter ExbD [Paraglaciecola chathamensis]MBU3020122.1 biopolymer transporter ExbD [Paraglaciecola agarilytica]MDO6560680.1 biopolymer transporter ExbD [Paraglaciecola chathamensis]|tara:strand:+ start:555 stop:962 length:408 start_codon:yes stop_codon:yes gene_type:complete